MKEGKNDCARSHKNVGFPGFVAHKNTVAPTPRTRPLTNPPLDEPAPCTMPNHSACALVAEAVAAAGFIVRSASFAPAPASASLGAAAALGAALTASTWVSRPASGGHVNPASTTALMVTGAYSQGAAAWVLGGQLLGALVGGAALAALLPGARLFRSSGAPGCVDMLPSR